MSHNWQNILIGPSETIQTALKVIDGEALKLALVVDGNKKLLGTLSDGDIRRALIDGTSLNRAVSDIMNTSPTTASSEQTRGNLLEIMEKKELLSIPILCDDIVIGLETLHNVVQQKSYENPVFLMAGGFGTRLKPLTDHCPKPLLKVGDKPILETVIKSFIKSGFSNFFISTHYLPEMIKEYFGDGQQWGVSITYIHETCPLGTGGALGLLPKTLSKLPIIVMNGDVLTKIDFEKLLEFHIDNNSRATMCVREYEYQVPFGVVESQGYIIKSLVEKPIQRFHVNAGIYVIGNEVIQSVKHNEYIDMPSLFEQHIGNQLLVYPFHDYWLDIGRMDDFSRAQEDYKTLGF
jgi:dTDP-glucose pyrophosphorylase/predicted transcriptional regulator